MFLSVGDRLGRYQILELLGSGGMGEVYLARDAELERLVAVKVLPQEVSRDPGRLERFRREAKAIAKLQTSYCIKRRVFMASFSFVSLIWSSVPEAVNSRPPATVRDARAIRFR